MEISVKSAHHTSSLLAVWAPFNCCGEAYLGRELGTKLGRSTAKISEVHMGGSINGSSPKWLVYRENPIKMDDLGVPLFWETPYLPMISTSKHAMICPGVKVTSPALQLLRIHAAVFHRTCSLQTKYHPAMAPMTAISTIWIWHKYGRIPWMAINTVNIIW